MFSMGRGELRDLLIRTPSARGNAASTFPGHPTSPLHRTTGNKTLMGRHEAAATALPLAPWDKEYGDAAQHSPSKKPAQHQYLCSQAFPGKLSALKLQQRQRPWGDTWDSATACAHRMLCCRLTNKKAHTGWMQPPVMSFSQLRFMTLMTSSRGKNCSSSFLGSFQMQLLTQDCNHNDLQQLFPSCTVPQG